MWEGISYIMKKLLLLIGILVLTLGCSSEPEIIYRDVEVVVTATPTYPLYTSGEAEAKITKYIKSEDYLYWYKGGSTWISCYRTEFPYANASDPDTDLTGTFTWNMLSYDNSNYAWTLQRVASPSVDFHPNYKWTLYERTETISSDHPDC